ncbi:MAG: hypothetical protein PVG51_02140 [Desulfosarcina sp.]
MFRFRSNYLNRNESIYLKESVANHIAYMKMAFRSAGNSARSDPNGVRPEGGDGYAIKKLIFERMYEEINPKLELTAEQQSYINDRIQPKIEEFKTKAHKNERQYYFWRRLQSLPPPSSPSLAALLLRTHYT